MDSAVDLGEGTVLGHRRVLLASALALVAGFGLTGGPAIAAAPRIRGTTCPPEYLGTTTSADPRISDDGRFAVIDTRPPGSAGAGGAILVRDLRRGLTVQISDPDPFQTGGGVADFLPDISGDGGRVSYLRFDADDSLNNARMRVYDRRTGARTVEGESYVIDRPDLSGDGRYLAFAKQGALPHIVDVYLRDVDHDITTLVSADPNGQPGNNLSIEPQISDNGRYVLFLSEATNLTPDSGGVGNRGALFLRDVRTQHTTAIPDRNGDIGVRDMMNHQLSPDGRYVVYTDAQGAWRYDRLTGRTVRASKPSSRPYDVAVADVSAYGRSVLLNTRNTGLAVRNPVSGKQTAVANLLAYPGALTPNGRYVIFYSDEPGLDPNDKAGPDAVSVYVRDLQEKTTRLVSTRHAGGVCEP